MCKFDKVKSPSVICMYYAWIEFITEHYFLKEIVFCLGEHFLGKTDWSFRAQQGALLVHF